jgi:hypothetical protein
MGWGLPPLATHLAAVHGPLMICGFLGTLITLERAVALRVRVFYLAPLCAALGAVLLLTPSFGGLGIWLLTASSAGLVVMMVYAARLQPALFTYIMVMGACMWLIGNLLWLAGIGIANVVLWWSAFLILTIAGERLELSRLLRISRNAEILFLVAVIALCGGVVLNTVELVLIPDAALFVGSWLAGAGMIMLALWLLRYDIARRNVRLRELPQFIAVCLISGYIWLAVGGLLRLASAGARAGVGYDAMLHAVLVGFVFGMIFAHAPIILPAILNRAVPFRSVMYAPWLLLQIGLVLRIFGDVTNELTVRQWGGMLNVLAILLFFAMMAFTIFAGVSKRETKRTLLPPHD